MKFLMSISRLLVKTTESMRAVGNEVNTILKSWVSPVFTALSGAGIIYIIILGVQYAKSESEEKRAEAKKRMLNCLIGIIVMLVLVALCLMVNWAEFVQIFGYAAA